MKISIFGVYPVVRSVKLACKKTAKKLDSFSHKVNPSRAERYLKFEGMNYVSGSAILPGKIRKIRTRIGEPVARTKFRLTLKIHEENNGGVIYVIKFHVNLHKFQPRFSEFRQR